MEESIFNLFLYIENRHITSVGIFSHIRHGMDDEKLSFLRSRVNLDCHGAAKFPLSNPISWQSYEAMMRLGRHLQLFEPALQSVSASQTPIMVITPIIDGLPYIVATIGLGPIDLKDLEDVGPQQGSMPDYLQMYIMDGAFDIPRMLNDDYFQAIKLLFNAGKYVSASKLLMSFIDTMSFVEYGDTPANFIKWLDEFVDLASIGVTSNEIWEFRNGVVHTTSPDSRKVVAGKVSRVILYIGNKSLKTLSEDGYRYLDLHAFIQVILQSLPKWIESYNVNPEKFMNFIPRYDSIISDTRVAVMVKC